MVPALLADRLSVSAHHPLGASTGYMVDARNDWPSLTAAAVDVSSAAVELAALSENELPGLIDFLANEGRLPFRFVSVHAPIKGRSMDDDATADALAALPDWIDAIVIHPDVIENLSPYAQFGRQLVVENMDSRKNAGRSVADLQAAFSELPDAGFCFDVAHAWSVDRSMDLAMELLDAFATRLSHVHVSSLDERGRHQPLTDEHEALFMPALSRCSDVPWILEAPLTD